MLTAAPFQACLDVFHGCLLSKSYAWLMETYLPRYSFKWLISRGSTRCGLSVTLPSTGVLPLLRQGTWTTWVWAQNFSVQASACCIWVRGPQLWTRLLVHAGISLPQRHLACPRSYPMQRKTERQHGHFCWKVMVLCSYRLKPSFCLWLYKKVHVEQGLKPSISLDLSSSAVSVFTSTWGLNP